MRSLVIAAVFWVACAKEGPAPATPDRGSAPEEPGSAEEPTGVTSPDELRGEVALLRDALITGWQTPPGEATLSVACKQAGHYLIAARLVRDGAPPAGVDAAAWRQTGEALVEAAGGLDGACFRRFEDPSSHAGASELTALHDATARLLALAPGILGDS